jgi:two-component SAPR family response regulator
MIKIYKFFFRINYKFLLRINNTCKVVFLYIICFQAFNAQAQGLLFKSNDSLLTKRTSLHVFNSDIPEFRHHVFVNFDLSLWDNSNLGYVFNISDKDNSYSLSYIYNNNAGYLNFNIDSKSNKIKIPLQQEILKKKRWMKVKINFDLDSDKLIINIDDQIYHADKLGFKGQIPANIIFGKNQFYTEVPNMAIKNLSVGDDSKGYFFPLDEWSGGSVHDKNGEATGLVENPVWLINESYFWKPVYTKTFYDVAGLNFNTTDQSLFIFSKDSLISFDPELKTVSSFPYKNKLPVPMVLGKSIYNPWLNKCYVYELFDIPKGTSSVAALNLDKNNLSWQVVGKATWPYQLHHHNIFYDFKHDNFYLFGGYGNFNYHNIFLKYNDTTDKWEKVIFKGDLITPRFFAATGNSDKPDELFLFGGYGNESGNQIVGGKQVYDLFRINLKDHTVKKCWNIHPAGEVFVPANNLILSNDKKYFYALCYPHEIAKTELRLYKFSIKDGSYEVVSAPIPVTSERIETDINLFFNRKTEEFVCTIQEFTDRKKSAIKIYSLISPPVSKTTYLSSLNPQNKSRAILIYIGLSFLVIVVAGGLTILYRKRSGRSLTEIKNNSEHPLETKNVERKKNAAYLLGEFLVFNKKENDITYLFSPKIKQLFILILLNSKENKGISSKKISTTLWPDKDITKAKNIKGVTFNHLRSIISDIEGIELTFFNDTYSFKINETFFCDYWILMDVFKNANDLNDKSFSENLHIILRGTLLKNTYEPWLDDFKYKYEEKLTSMIMPELKRQYELNELKQVLEIAKLMLDIDPFNDDSLKYQLKSLSRLKGIEYARKIYDQFIQEYKRSLGVDYPVSFEKIVH